MSLRNLRDGPDRPVVRRARDLVRILECLAYHASVGIDARVRPHVSIVSDSKIGHGVTLMSTK